MPERRTKCIATGIFHCTEYMIDLSLKFSVSVFLFFFFLLEGSILALKKSSVTSCELPV